VNDVAVVSAAFLLSFPKAFLAAEWERRFAMATDLSE